MNFIEVQSKNWEWYINQPEKNDDGPTILRSIEGTSPYGLGVFVIPGSYSSGDILKWIILCNASAKADFSISVQTGNGQENTLSVYDLTIPKEDIISVIESEPVVVDAFKPNAYCFTSVPNVEIYIYRMFLVPAKIDSMAKINKYLPVALAGTAGAVLGYVSGKR